MTEKIQIKSADLASILNIGEIVDMYVVPEGNRQVLRIEYMNVKHEEYKTLELPAKTRASSRKQPKPRKEPAPRRERQGQNRGILGGALSTVFGDDYRNQKPEWMK